MSYVNYMKIFMNHLNQIIFFIIYKDEFVKLNLFIIFYSIVDSFCLIIFSNMIHNIIIYRKKIIKKCLVSFYILYIKTMTYIFLKIFLTLFEKI